MLTFEQHINENSYDNNRKINLLNDVLKHGWLYALRNINSAQYRYWINFFSQELKLGVDFISTLRRVFDNNDYATSNRYKSRDIWKYQVGRDPKDEYESELNRYILLLDRYTYKYESILKDWIAANSEF